MNTTLQDEDKLFRYVSFEALLDHLVCKRFSFRKFGSFNDPWEGFFHKSYFKENEHKFYGFVGMHRALIMCFTKRVSSEAMWRIYSKDATGVMIVTSVEKLRSLTRSCPEFECHLREVTYDDDIKEDDFFVRKHPDKSIDERELECLFLKRKAFDHEEEVRLVLRTQENFQGDVYYVNADPNDVIEEVILDPRINEATYKLKFCNLIELGFKGIVQKSKLYSFKPVRYRTK